MGLSFSKISDPILSRHWLKDYLLMALGAFLTAVALNCFLIPGELAAGGASGLATIIYHIGLRFDLYIPVGFQTLVMNALLLVPVFKSGGFRYASRTIFGIVALAVFIDISAPFLPNLVNDELLLAAVCGGILTGIGLGLVFKSGGNTGGTDIVAQLIAKHSSMSVGAWLLIIDLLIIAASAPVFSPQAALCAAISMGITAYIIDRVVDGLVTERAAWIISSKYEELTPLILHELGRGCTCFEAKGTWTNKDRPVLFVVLSRKELNLLKNIVSSVDKDAIVIISEVTEAFGEGFKEMGVQ